MLKVKGNYKNGFPDQTCRACQNSPETQAHVLYDCKKLNPEVSTSNENPDNTNNNPENLNKENEKYPDFFNEDPNSLKTIARSIETTMEILVNGSDNMC